MRRPDNGTLSISRRGKTNAPIGKRAFALSHDDPAGSYFEKKKNTLIRRSSVAGV